MKKTPKIIILLTILLFTYGFLLGGQQLVLTTVSEQFGMGVLGMGTMVSALHVSSTIAPAVMGALADRIGKKKVLVSFAVIFGAGCFLAAFASGLWVFLGAMLIIGAGYSVCESLTSAVCVEVSSQDGARYVNLTQCLLSVGAILGPMVMARIPSWRVLYILVGVPLVVLGLILSRTAFPRGETRQKKEKEASGNLLLQPIFLTFMIAMLMYVGLESGFGYFIEPLYDLKTGAADLSAYGISAYWAGMALSRLIYSLRAYRPRRTVQLSFAAAAALFLALIAVPSGGVCIALCALVGFAYGPIWTTIVAGAAQRFPEHRASATGLMSASCGLGGILYPAVMGAMVELLDIRVGFVILAVSALVGAAMSFALQKK